ncbi:ligand-gated channel [Thalassotalea insulae]|uniref:Ligand-gated channel n=1 Tax=Thalassotalea insulae TaxID=2056778 RepID=A0ABQ6GUH8_9GAMM|nr:TonB-dependent receptor [Thalassotalea insulae]GLX79593.1 ligand-gated channel [Thalassotalea insulae]
MSLLLSSTSNSQLSIRLATCLWQNIAALLAVMLLPLSFQVKADKLYYFDIKSLPADQALIAFAKHSQRTIIFSYELTKHYQANELNGYFTIAHGLNRLLRHTELEAHINSNDEIRIQLRQPAHKQDSITRSTSKALIAKQEESNNRIEKIAIVGTRNIARSIQELPVPVDVLSETMLANTGQFENGRKLQTIAPSFNFASSSISDGTDVLKPATLRGLGPDQTLLLVNGKRRHHSSLVHINTSVGRGTSGVGINAIPFSAIKRIEILRDGAAAQYGSDAIAGVINIVLKDSTSKGHITTSYGQYGKGDGQSAELNINKGFSFKNNGFFNATINVQDHQATDRSGQHGSCQFPGCVRLAPEQFLAKDPREFSAKRDTFDIGDPAYQQFSLAYNSQYNLTDGKLYSFAIYSKRENDAAAFFRDNLNQQANPMLQDGEPLVPGGYLPFIHSDIADASFSLGYKTELNPDILMDISYSYGVNSIDYTTKNSVNASYAIMLEQQGITAQQIREQMPNSADAYGLKLSLQTINLDIQKFFSYATLALGLELRKDRYQVIAGNQYSYFDYHSPAPPSGPNKVLAGIQGFPGIAPNAEVDEQRDIASIYVEVNSELSEYFNYSAALRYDDYQDFGSTSNIKLAANWRPFEHFNLRSSISTGFRAPSMQQLYFNNTSTQFIVNQENQLSSEQVGTFRNDSQLAQIIGLPQLTEEQSKNFSLGAVFNFTEQFNVTIDYYAINIDDRIVISNKLSAEQSPSLAQAIKHTGVDKAQVFLNGADTQTQGLDIISTWHSQLFSGQHTLTLAANFTDTDVTRLYSPKNSALSPLDNEQVFARQDISIIEQWQPKDRISLTSLYQQQSWSLNLALNRYGKYTIIDGEQQTYGAKTLTDIRFQHDLSNNFSWYLGVNNLFDVTPDKNTIGNSHAGTIVDQQGNTIVSSLGVFKYSRRSAPFGFNGSYFYLGVNYHF